MESLTTSELRVLIAGLERVRGGLGRFSTCDT